MATKRVVDLVPGDRLAVAATRTVGSFLRDEASVTVTFTDGTVEVWDLAGDPAVETVDD